jgi:hypothetical protein
VAERRHCSRDTALAWRWRGLIWMPAGDQVVTNNFGDRSPFGVSTASYSIFHSEMRLSGATALRSTLA